MNCLECGGQRLISGAGCEIPAGTPHENLQIETFNFLFSTSWASLLIFTALFILSLLKLAKGQ